MSNEILFKTKCIELDKGKYLLFLSHGNSSVRDFSNRKISRNWGIFPAESPELRSQYGPKSFNPITDPDMYIKSEEKYLKELIAKIVKRNNSNKTSVTYDGDITCEQVENELGWYLQFEFSYQTPPSYNAYIEFIKNGFKHAIPLSKFNNGRTWIDFEFQHYFEIENKQILENDPSLKPPFKSSIIENINDFEKQREQILKWWNKNKESFVDKKWLPYALNVEGIRP